MQEYTKQFQRELGPHVTEQKLDQYMRTHTKARTDILDPTSRLKVYPSAATVTKQSNFGTGSAAPDVVAKVAQKHTDDGLTMITSLLPKPLQSAEQSVMGAAEERRDARAKVLSQSTSAAMSKSAEMLAAAEYQHSWQPRGAKPGEGNQGVSSTSLSKFERRVSFWPACLTTRCGTDLLHLWSCGLIRLQSKCHCARDAVS
jgi:hypothetical protein